MAKRQVIRIDEALCDGCGQCVDACAEGAIRMVDGKARLVSDTYCDGLGACLGECPQGAITLEEREAAPFDEAAVHAHLARTDGGGAHEAAATPAPAAAGHADNAPEDAGCPSGPGGGCPGSGLRDFRVLVAGMRPGTGTRTVGPAAPTAAAGSPGAGSTTHAGATDGRTDATADAPPPASLLGHWPVQLGLVPPSAPFLAGADLLICADCVPFVVPDFHARYLSGRAVVVACPKLDDMAPHRDRLAGILALGRPARVTVLRMEVPCCGGLARAVLDARDAHAPDLPVAIHTWGVRGGGGAIQEYPPKG
jgi:Pyruvate/2-oxoacid:ferredoxin oxidoreductase delta subunit